jgi:hypothetical protein
MRAAIQILTAFMMLFALVAATPLQRRQQAEQVEATDCTTENVQYAVTCTAGCRGSVKQQVKCMKACTEDIDNEEYVSRSKSVPRPRLIHLERMRAGSV